MIPNIKLSPTPRGILLNGLIAILAMVWFFSDSLAQPAFSPKWEFKAPGTFLAPAVGPNGVVVVAAGSTVYAVDSQSGRLSWSFPANQLIKAPPSIAKDGTIYIACQQEWLQFDVYALDGSTGQVKWMYEYNDTEFVARIASSLAIGSDGGVFISVTFGSWKRNDYALIKLKEESGIKDWDRFISGEAKFIQIDSNGVLNIGSNRIWFDEDIHSEPGLWLTRFQTETGVQRGYFSYGSHEFNAPPVIDAEGSIYLATSQSSTNVDGGQIVTPVITALRNPDWQIAWSTPFNGNGTPSVGVKGTVFATSGTTGPGFLALDPRTGTKKWDAPVTNTLKTTWISSPVIGSDGTVYVTRNENWGSSLGIYGIIQALDEETGQLKRELVLDGGFSAAPTMGLDGTLYLAGYGKVYAVSSGSPGPANSPWPMQAQNPRRTGNQADGSFPPVATVNSSRIEFFAGRNLELLGNAFGAPLPAVAWEHDGVPMANETNGVLKIVGAQSDDAGLYRLRVSSPLGSGLSEPVSVFPVGTPQVLANGVEVLGQGRFADRVQLELKTSFENGLVFFTRDGSTPTPNSSLYQQPISLTDSVVIRAVAYSADLTRSATTGPVSIQVVPGYSLTGEVTGNGRIDQDPVREVYLQGEVVKVRAVPAEGWKFVRWEGSLSGNFAEAEVVMVAPRSIRAVFEVLPHYSLQLGVVGRGKSGQAPLRESYLQNDRVHLKAVPETGWRFVRWEGDFSGTSPEGALNIEHDTIVNAVFEALAEYTVTTAAPGGSVSGGGTYYDGTGITLTATADEGWSFLGWTGDHTGAEPSFPWTVTGPANFTAEFGTSLTTFVTGPGRVELDPDLATYPYGTRVQVTPIPDSGNYLALWGDAGAGAAKTGFVLEVTNAQPRVTALFTPVSQGQVVLSVSTVGGGTVVGDPPSMVFNSGEVVTLTATPWVGFTFLGWSGDISGVQADEILTLPMTRSRNVTATFAAGSAPVVVPLANRSVEKSTPLTVAVVASDPEGGSLLYELKERPDGMVIGLDGVIHWTPTAGQGPGNYPVRVRVIDTSGLSTESGFVVTVLDGNSPPVINTIPIQVIDEGSLFTLELTAVDPDVPAQPLVFSLVRGPHGLSVTPAGALSWTPTESQGPGTNSIGVRVNDGLVSVTNVFEVVVREVNSPPVLGVLSDIIANPGEGVRLNLSATDPDIPEQTLTFSVVSGPPGVTITPGGEVTWAPTSVDSPSTNEVVVRVTDSGVPSLSATGSFRVIVSNTPGVEGLVWVAPGSFEMGSPIDEPDRGQDEVQHQVHISRGFWLSDHEATQAEFEALMGYNPSEFRGALLPVERVSWYEAMQYCQTLNARERAAGRLPADYEYRLPTEAEWEFACRAGTSGRFAGSLPDLAWFDLNSGGTAHPVKTKQSNGWGLYDMHGNVWEWCLDRYAPYPTEPVADPSGPGSGPKGVYRGGGWLNGSWGCRSAYRFVREPEFRGVRLGFRLALGPIMPVPNAAPTWTAIPDQEVEEGSVLSLTLNAVDPDVPAQALTFLLLSGPGGVTVTPGGLVSWTPTEAQGPSTNVVVLTVSDGLAKATNQFVVRVREVNAAPVLETAWDEVIDEGTPFFRQLIASDSDLPAQSVDISLVSAPSGMVMILGGALTWGPLESQGPSTNRVAVRLSDGVVAVTNSFQIVVREVNLPPHLDPVADQTLDPGLPLELLLTSTDPDLPEQTLTFALVEGPAGLSVSAKGALRWMPTAEQTPSTNQVRLLVGDGALTATTAFTVIVRDPSLPPPPVLQLDADRPDGRLALEIRARLGLELILETASKLGPWTEVQRLTGLGESMPITVVLTPGSGTEPRFWRVKTQ